MTLTELLELDDDSPTPRIFFRCPACRLLTNEPGGGQCPTCTGRINGSWAEDEHGVRLSSSAPRRGRIRRPLPPQRVADERPHVLYRFFDATGALLYIGITVDLRHRLCEHFGPCNGGKEWQRVASITLQHYPSREAVQAAEAVAIATECPTWNSIRYKRRERERAKATS